jgi:hypothetical protein
MSQGRVGIRRVGKAQKEDSHKQYVKHIDFNNAGSDLITNVVVLLCLSFGLCWPSSCKAHKQRFSALLSSLPHLVC